MRHILPTLAIASAAAALVANQAAGQLFIDDFADGELAGWQGKDPFVIDSGGAGGIDDPYLLVTSSSGGGQGSRLAVFNQDERWTDVGPLFTADVLYGDSFDLELRVVLFAADGSRWTSTDAVPVTAGDDWQTVQFDVFNESSLTRVAGTASFDETLATLERTMIRHDSGGPSSGGTPIATGIGIDNIGYTVVPEPASLGLLGLGTLALRRRR